MKWLKRMAAKQSKMERTPAEDETGSLDRERHRREQMKRKAADSGGGPVRTPEKPAAAGDGKVHELKEALQRGEIRHDRKRQAILDAIGKDHDKEHAAMLLRELDETWRTERELLKKRLREVDSRS